MFILNLGSLDIPVEVERTGMSTLPSLIVFARSEATKQSP